MSKPSVYAQTKSPNPTSDDHYKRTLARIDQIQTHLARTPRGTRLKGKVCIITGVGSLKGIGCACSIYRSDFFIDGSEMDRRASAMLYAHEGTTHTAYTSPPRMKAN